MTQYITGESQRPPWPEATRERVMGLLCGNEAATQFVIDIAFVSHVYDDLIDGDKSVPKDCIHSAVWKMLIAIPMNAFYKSHESMLRPVLITGILNWRAANDMQEAGVEEELHIAHALRYSIADVLVLSMALVGGQEHAAMNAREARLISQQDTWSNYLAEHRKETRHEAPQAV